MDLQEFLNHFEYSSLILVKPTFWGNNLAEKKSAKWKFTVGNDFVPPFEIGKILAPPFLPQISSPFGVADLRNIFAA